MTLSFCAFLIFWNAGVNGFLLGIDLGSQYFKAAVVAPGKPFEVVHNQHSKRKTPTAVSFHETVRTFGDDALASGTRGAAKTPMWFPLQLGRDASIVKEAELHWLPTKFYPFALGANDSGSLRFDVGDDGYSVIEVAAHVLGFAKSLAEQTVEGTPISETILTVPSYATFLQRRALIDAAGIAGLPRTQLVNEISAAALQRALDLDLTGANESRNTSTTLYFNMGARHVEACIVGYRGATHLDKPTVSMDVLGCGHNLELGGHHVDLNIAEKMLAAFKTKYPKLAEGIVKNTRALRKLEKEAMALKHVLSANKEGQFRVESLYEDTDFMQPVKREEMEAWSAELFSFVSRPVEAALKSANLTLEAIDTVEMIGGGWRIPKVQSLLSEYLQSQRAQQSDPLNLSQHVNGDEAMATGSAFYGANSSVSFRTKKVFFTDHTPHTYVLVLSPLNHSQPHDEGWSQSTELFGAGASFRSKKTIKLNVTFDLAATLLENGKEVLRWSMPGIHDASTGKYAHLGFPLVSIKLDLDGSGLVRLASATAIFDERVLVPVVESVSAVLGNASNSSENVTADGGLEENATVSSEDIKEENATDSSDDVKEPNITNGLVQDNATQDSNNTETIAPKTKIRIKKVKVSIDAVEHFLGIHPRPLSAEEKAAAVSRLAAMNAADAEVRKVDFAKNALESFIYESREKIGGDDEHVQKVSTDEQRSEVSELSMALEEWLYEEDAATANASVFEDKLKSLQSVVFPILNRAFEFEHRPQLPEIIEKVKSYCNLTLTYVEKNMTWVSAKEREGVANMTSKFDSWYANLTEQQSTRSLTEDPAFTYNDVAKALRAIQSEAQRLTKIQKIEPSPYGYGNTGGYGGYEGYGGYGKYSDPKMREYYDAMYRNMSANGSYDWMKNFSNFSNYNDSYNSDYMKSFYEHYARNFSAGDANTSDHAGDSGVGEQNETGERTEL